MVDILYQGDMDMLNQNYKELAKIIKDAKLTIKEFKEPNKPKEQIKEIDIRVLDKDRTELFKIMDFNTIKEISYVLNMKQQDISNYYHQLINLL